MNWDNYGKYWHLDHIKPASWFKYSSHTDKDFLQCWSLNNLQPLKAMDNMLTDAIKQEVEEFAHDKSALVEARVQ